MGRVRRVQCGMIGSSRQRAFVALANEASAICIPSVRQIKVQREEGLGHGGEKGRQ